MIKWFPALLSLLLLSFTAELQAHSRSESYSKWKVIDSHQVELHYTLKLADLEKMDSIFKTQFPDWQNRVSQHVNNTLQLLDADRPCKDASPMHFETQSLYLQLKKTFYCDNTDKLSLINNSIFDIDTRHIHIARFTLKNGDIAEKVFLSNDRFWSINKIESSANTLKSFVNYFILGAEHIVSGWDHLAFLGAILLLVLMSGASIKTLFLIVTGFTLGHSLSLILTSLGFLIPDSLSIESLIAFSIILISVESIAQKQQEYFLFAVVFSLALLLYFSGSVFLFSSALTTKTLLGLIIFVFCYCLLSASTNPEQKSKLHTQLFITTIFGFIHGFGFAGSLQSIGLPQDKLISALIGFNLGVEAGQLLILIHVFLVLYLLRKITSSYWGNSRFIVMRETVTESLVAGLCGLGIFWFIERSII